jgi:hypothetical protein
MKRQISLTPPLAMKSVVRVNDKEFDSRQRWCAGEL